jgi:hypothetical protein
MATGQPAPQTPYTTVPRTRQVRRIERKINSDWDYLAEQELSPNATSDEQFNAAYRTKGLQPQPLGTKNTPKAANDATYTESSPAYTRQPRVTSAPKESDEASTAKKLIARTKASAVNVSIMLWAGSLWTVQLVFALLSLVMIGLTSAVQTAAASSGFASAALWLANQVVAGAGLVLGFNGNLLGMAEGFAIASYMIVLALGIGSIFAAYLQYTFALLRPLSGEQASLKMGVLLLVILGYSVPFFNIFPWIFLWTAVVWKYPK